MSKVSDMAGSDHQNAPLDGTTECSNIYVTDLVDTSLFFATETTRRDVAQIYVPIQCIKDQT